MGDPAPRRVLFNGDEDAPQGSADNGKVDEFIKITATGGVLSVARMAAVRSLRKRSECHC